MTNKQETFHSYFAELLKDASKGQFGAKTPAKAIAYRTNIHETKISRIKKGKQKAEKDDVVAIVEAALGKGAFPVEKNKVARLYCRDFGVSLKFDGLPPVLEELSADENNVYTYLFVCSVWKSFNHLVRLFGTNTTTILDMLSENGWVDSDVTKAGRHFRVAVNDGYSKALKNEISLRISHNIEDGLLEQLSLFPFIETNDNEELTRRRKDLFFAVLTEVEKQKIDLEKFERLLQQRLTSQRGIDSYASGNLVNLLIVLRNNDLSKKDLSGLIVRQADFRGVRMHDSDLSKTQLFNCRFSDTFGSVWKTGFLADESFYAASTVSGTVKVWNSQSGLIRNNLGENEDTLHGWSFSFTSQINDRGSPNTDVSIASAGGAGEVRYWANAFDKTKRAIIFNAHETRVRGISLLKDGRLITCGEDGFIKSWHFNFEEFISKNLADTRVRWSSLAVSDDDQMCVAGNLNGEIYYGDLSVENPKFKKVTPQGHSNNINCLSISSDAKYIVSTDDDGEIRIYQAKRTEDVPTLKLESLLPNKSVKFKSCAFLGESSDELVLGSEHGDIIFLSRDEKGEFRKVYTKSKAHTSTIRSIGSSRDGDKLLTGGDDQTVQLWNIVRDTHGQVTTLKLRHAHSGVIASARSADHLLKTKILATGHDDGRIRFWTNDTKLSERRDFSSIQAHNEGRIWSLKFCPQPSGKDILVSAGEDGWIKGWVGNNSAPAFISEVPHNYRIFAIDVCEASSGLIVSCGQDKTVRLWNLDGKQLHCQNEAHTGRVRDVRFLPNRTIVVSCGEDRRARFWKLKEERSLILDFEFEADSNLTRIGMNKTGSKIYFACDDGTIISFCQESSERKSSAKISERPLLALGLIQEDKVIVCGGEDGHIYFLSSSDLSSVAAPIKCHKDWIEDISVSHESNSFITVSDDQFINRFNQHMQPPNWEGNKASLDYEGLIIDGIQGDDVTDILLEKLRALGATDRLRVQNEY